MGGQGILDGTPLLDIFYLSAAGGMLFHGSGGVYEGHYLFTAPAPCELALGMVHACMLEGAELIWGRVPVGNRAARIFTRKIGFNSLGLRERPFPAEWFWKMAL
jgi:hypothetical protein